MKTIWYIKFLLTNAWRLGKSYCVVTALNSIFRAFLPLINIVGLGSVVGALETNVSLVDVIKIIAVYLGVNLGVACVREILQLFENNIMRVTSNTMQFNYARDAVNINYHYVQDKAILNLRRKSMLAYPAFYLSRLGDFLNYIVQFAGIIFIFSYLSPLFLLLLILLSAVCVALTFKTRKNDFDFQNEKVDEDRKLDYLYGVMTEYKFAKEIRINNVQGYVAHKYTGILARQITKLKDLYKKRIAINLLSTSATIAQTILMYFYFSYQVYVGNISIAEYTVLLGATTLCTSILLQFFDSIAVIGRTFGAVDFYKEYQDLIEKQSNITQSNNLDEKNIDFSNIAISFENVSFKYPETERFVLRDINLDLRSGEKIGLVGLNGSGKTTLVKLLMRIYDPTDGQIKLNGVDIKEIPHRQYIAHIGAVLQDFTLFAYSVRENVVLEADYDKAKFNESLIKSSIFDKVASLKNGADTSVYKVLDENGVEFSGGEGQKLALARAIYKNADALILDEPTSALDPIAEYELFAKLDEISDGKATLFISHRLSSTKFCDKIIVLSDGEIIEQGSHGELMTQGGEYARLFNAQAQYYKANKEEQL